MDWGNWKVVSSNTETKSIGNIVDSVDSSLISIVVRSSHTSIGIAGLLLGRVDVLVTIGNIAKLILSLVLGASWSSNWGSSSIGGRDSWGSSNWSSGKWSSIQSCNWSTIGKLGINCHWGGIGSSIWSSSIVISS